MGRLDGKVAIVTGAARGMGEAEARLFAAEGARVVVADVLDEQAAAVAESIGDAARAVHLDVRDEAGWEDALAATVETFGVPDVLVNNAGVLGVTPVLTADLDLFRTILEINLVGSFIGMHVVGGAMVEAGRGSIVNVSSTGGLIGQSTIGGYVASKWGVRGLTKSVAIELGSLGVRVNSIHPGGIATSMLGVDDLDVMTEPPPPGAGDPNPATAAVDELVSRVPLRRAGRPIEVARMALFLASDEASYCTGMEFVVDGGSVAGLDLSGRL